MMSALVLGLKGFVAAAMGWMLDAFDAMLYALVIAYVMRDLGIGKPTAGLLNSLTLLASGIGGVAFGFLADRIYSSVPAISR
jgi:MFS family permease